MHNSSVGGDDRLVSAANTADNMWGDAQLMDASSQGGHDTFVFDPNNGNDIIHDFQQGMDLIELDGFFKSAGAGSHIPSHAVDHMPSQATGGLLISFADLNITMSDTNNDGHVDSSVIHFDANNSITVADVLELHASDFLMHA